MSTTAATGKKISIGGGIIIAILLVLMQMATMMPYLMPGITMTEMVTDLGIDYALAGMSITIIVCIGGVFMLIAPFIQARLGYWTTVIVGIAALIAGNFLMLAAVDGASLMASRVFLGIGYGLCANSANPLIACFYEGKAKTYMITVNLVATSVGIALAYQLPGWFGPVMGGWKNVYIVTGIYSVILLALWVIFAFVFKAAALGRKTKEERLAARSISFSQSSLGRAMRFKQFWFVAIIGIFCSMLTNLSGYYLPTILTLEKGMTQEFAANVSSLGTLCSIVGSLVMGVIVAQTGRRKPWMAVCIALAFGSIFTLLSTSIAPLIMTMSIINGIVGMGLYPPQSTLLMETQPDYRILGGVFALASAPGLLIQIVAPNIFMAIVGGVGSMSASYKVMSIGYLIALAIAIFCLRETGPHARKNVKEES